MQLIPGVLRATVVMTGWADAVLRFRDSAIGYWIAMNASRRFGRSIKLSKAGKPREALGVAREGLSMLADSRVDRQQAAEGSVLACLTYQVEWMADELAEAGASEKDLVESIACLRGLPESSSQSVREAITWIPFLEVRLAKARSARASTEAGLAST